MLLLLPRRSLEEYLLFDFPSMFNQQTRKQSYRTCYRSLYNDHLLIPLIELEMPTSRVCSNIQQITRTIWILNFGRT